MSESREGSRRYPSNILIIEMAWNTSECFPVHFHKHWACFKFAYNFFSYVVQLWVWEKNPPGTWAYVLSLRKSEREPQRMHWIPLSAKEGKACQELSLVSEQVCAGNRAVQTYCGLEWSMHWYISWNSGSNLWSYNNFSAMALWTSFPSP